MEFWQTPVDQIMSNLSVKAVKAYKIMEKSDYDRAKEYLYEYDSLEDCQDSLESFYDVIMEILEGNII